MIPALKRFYNILGDKKLWNQHKETGWGPGLEGEFVCRNMLTTDWRGDSVSKNTGCFSVVSVSSTHMATPVLGDPLPLSLCCELQTHRQCIYTHAAKVSHTAFTSSPWWTLTWSWKQNKPFLPMLLLTGYFITAEMRLEHRPRERMGAIAEIPYCLCLGQKRWSD